MSPDNTSQEYYRYDVCMSTDNDELKWTSAEIGLHIRELREKRGISMYQLALDSGISNSVLMRIEKGEREARVNTVLKIIEGLGITPAEFFREFV